MGDDCLIMSTFDIMNMYNLFYTGYNLDYGKYYEDIMLRSSKDPEFTEIDAEYNGFGGNINVDINSLNKELLDHYTSFIEDNGFDVYTFMKYTRATHTLYYSTGNIFHIEHYKLVYVNNKFAFHMLSSKAIPISAFPERYIYFYEIYQKDSNHCHYGYCFTYKEAYNKIKNYRGLKYGKLYRVSLCHKELPSIAFSKDRAKELYYDIESTIPDNPRSYYEYLMDISDGEVYEYDENMNIFWKSFQLTSKSKFTREELLDYHFYKKARHFHAEYGKFTFMDYLIVKDYEVCL